MRKKIAIANQLRVSRKKFSNNREYKKLCSKCYRTYVIECVIKGKENFQISFGSKYIKSFSKRAYDWYIFFLDCIYFGPIYASKPKHLKIAEIPNERVLYYFLEKNGFKIIGEHLYSYSTVYDVTRV